MKRCRQCAEKIQSAAKVCRYCQAEQPTPAKTNNGPIIAVSAIVLLILLAVGKGTDPSPGTKVERAPIAQTQIDPYGNCLMRGMNNMSFNFSRLVKERLRNPASFEHVSTKPGPVENGVFAVMMTYRATNGYGAVDTSVAGGEIRVGDCAAKVVM